MVPRVVFVAVVVLLVAACASPSTTASPPPGTPGPSPTPAPTPTASGQPDGVTSAAQAAALVLASDPHFASIRPPDSGLIGECCSYEAVDEPPGYQVKVELGWGDCPAGCISHHRWQFHVDPDGTITLVSQAGDPDPPAPSGEGVTASVTLHLRAGPVCPVVREPPDPGCEPRSVANAQVSVRSPNGTELAHATSNADGEIQLQLPPAAYYVEPQPVEGLMGTAAAVAFSVVAGETVEISLDYDTGIR
jgi:hypothetical protein